MGAAPTLALETPSQERSYCTSRRWPASSTQSSSYVTMSPRPNLAMPSSKDSLPNYIFLFE